MTETLIIETLIIENSSTPGAIGDTLASFPALHAYAWKAEAPIDVYLSSVPCRPLLTHHKINQLTDRPEKAKILDIQTIYAKHKSSGWSMAQGYMEAIGLADIAATRPPELTIELGNQPELIKTPNVLIAPFSHSDNGTNTKLWPEEKWENLIWALWQKRLTIGLLGTSKDVESNIFWDRQPLFHYLDKPLQEVSWMLKFASLVISVDNGINWLTQAVKSNHLLFLPNTSHPGWTGNRNPNALNCNINISYEEAINLSVNSLGVK